MKKIKPEEIWSYLDDHILIDVRSPAEFAHAHVPNAMSLPLFNDAERAQVGTIYKQQSPEAALLKGLDFVGAKMSGFIKKANKWSPNRKVIVQCWRGGKRSGSMAWLLQFAGFEVVTVAGGYKAYRQHVLQQFNNQKLKLIVIGGKTGSGKTAILKELKSLGEQVIDLEALAHHKGSAFGWIGENKQPSSEQFDNHLFDVFRQLDPTKRVWIENESRSIGTVFIQQSFWQQMKSAPIIHIELPFEERVNHLVSVYAQTQIEDLCLSFEKITKKLGYENTQKAIELVKNEQFEAAAAIALKYYDKTYNFGFDLLPIDQKYIVEVSKFDPQTTANLLIEEAQSSIY
ncbi:MAG: tRNA 2-selenouridine(34) synthase MnmH [Saprospiraceae bacterium]|nr:tRNA 2-selenouridine(34) synthase MnmH [Saprospiraceae bacterium]